MTAKDIVKALLDIEEKTQKDAQVISRSKDKLPARIEAEAEHVRQKISNETKESMKQLQEELEKSTEERIQEIMEESARQLVDLEIDFDKHKKVLRAKLFERAIKWTTMP